MTPIKEASTFYGITNPFIAVGIIAQFDLGKPNAEDIIACCIEATGADALLVFDHCRKHKVVLCRQIAWKIMRENLTDLSLKELGQKFRDFDHTSVIHSLTVINERLKREGEIIRIYNHALELVRKRKMKNSFAKFIIN